MTQREIMLKKIGTYKFVLKDLELYLDTHPKDEMALSKYAEYEALLKPMVKEFESRFGPLTVSSDNGNKFLWVKNPWPWDIEEDD
ncbi:MAG: spore coat protein CotJB [Ruminococcus sp.]|nr:spore coat protein CotJB [Ruminococcus sp.]MBQ8538060.1 spore coat protein CotJB [Ruminococcus sp.]